MLRSLFRLTANTFFLCGLFTLAADAVLLGTLPLRLQSPFGSGFGFALQALALGSLFRLPLPHLFCEASMFRLEALAFCFETLALRGRL
jgi:hypothetical protein